MKIDMPSEREIKVEIDNIITEGLKKREPFYFYLKNMYRHVGIRYLFNDRLEISFIILLILSILFSVVKGSSAYYMENVESIYVYLFTVSPILYLTMSVFNFVNAKQNKTYEIEMTCKYNIYQIAAFRMLVFSIICILFNFFFVYTISYMYQSIDLLRAFIISIASLFLFSTIFLFTITKFRNRITRYFIILGWIIFNLALHVLKVDIYIQFISNISIYTWFIVTMGSMYIYIKNLKALIVFENKGGVV